MKKNVDSIHTLTFIQSWKLLTGDTTNTIIQDTHTHTKTKSTINRFHSKKAIQKTTTTSTTLKRNQPDHRRWKKKKKNFASHVCSARATQSLSFFLGQKNIHSDNSKLAIHSPNYSRASQAAARVPKTRTALRHLPCGMYGLKTTVSEMKNSYIHTHTQWIKTIFSLGLNHIRITFFFLPASQVICSI